jgi:hypothetical protein
MRSGEFSRMTVQYGTALAFVKPRNNNYGSVVPSELLDPSLDLTEGQRRDLARDVQDLFELYRAERDFYARIRP